MPSKPSEESQSNIESSPILNSRLSKTIGEYQKRASYTSADAQQIISLCKAVCTDDAAPLSQQQIKNINEIVTIAIRIRDTADRK